LKTRPGHLGTRVQAVCAAKQRRDQGAGHDNHHAAHCCHCSGGSFDRGRSSVHQENPYRDRHRGYVAEPGRRSVDGHQCPAHGGITFGLGTALAAVAAALVAPILLIYPMMGAPVIGMAFVIIIIGGMGSFFGAVLGGYLIGILETLVSSYVTTYFTEAIIFGLLVVVLAIKPTGLFGKEH
jgi:hypothetical protein